MDNLNDVATLNRLEKYLYIDDEALTAQILYPKYSPFVPQPPLKITTKCVGCNVLCNRGTLCCNICTCTDCIKKNAGICYGCGKDIRQSIDSQVSRLLGV